MLTTLLDFATDLGVSDSAERHGLYARLRRQTKPGLRLNGADCRPRSSTFVVMRDCGLPDALTMDHQFQQAGFHPLLLEESARLLHVRGSERLCRAANVFALYAKRAAFCSPKHQTFLQ